MTTDKPRLVVIGSGWAGFYIAQEVDLTKYAVTIISPRRTCAFTPLLASAAVGLFNFYLAEEPVRAKARTPLKFYKASVIDIDFDQKSCTCAPAFDDDEKLQEKEFTVPYDYLVVAPGCIPNTFGTPGVAEHALFMKNVTDAMTFRKTLFDLFEKASLPNQSDEEIRGLLHFAIVGGGPTGVEMTAELDDLLSKELKEIYPDIVRHAKISIYDVAPNILGTYDAKLHEYATKQLQSRGIEVSPSTQIEKVTAKTIHIKDQGAVPYGMLVWATGNKSAPLLETISDRVRFPEKGMQRILTDGNCRVYKSDEIAAQKSSTSDTYDSVFAIGDAADIEDQSLPTTAEVACQKAKYLVTNFNLAARKGRKLEDVMKEGKGFKYTSKQLVSYIGRRDGLILGEPGKDGKPQGWTGQSAWLSWRGSTLKWNRSWHARLMIVLTWIINYLFGIGIARM